MQSNQLKRNHPNKKKMIVARGGKRGKTAGRGGKGQSARAGNKRRPEWRDIIKKIPKLRGRGVNSNKPISAKSFAVNVDLLEKNFNNGDEVTPSILIEKGLVQLKSNNIPRIKILGTGKLTKTLNISGCLVSASAKTMIEGLKGKISG
jgi:large subunit ribosomal protein L15